MLNIYLKLIKKLCLYKMFDGLYLCTTAGYTQREERLQLVRVLIGIDCGRERRRERRKRERKRENM